MIVTRIDEALHYGQLAGHKILDREAVDAGLSAFLKTGQLGAAYEEWQERDKDQKSCANFKNWGQRKVKIKKQTQGSAGQLGFGMAGQEDEERIDRSVDNFAAAHNARQDSTTQHCKTTQSQR